MKQIWIYTCAISLISLFACQQEELPSNNNVGYLSLENISIQSANVETITTRVVDADLYVEIWDSEGKKQIGETHNPGTVSKIELEAGNYTLKAYNAAYNEQFSWGNDNKGTATYYIDNQSFTIEEGKVNYLSVKVPMTNIGIRLTLPERFSDWFTTYTFTAEIDKRNVSIANGETAYFPADQTIRYTLSATNKDGEQKTETKTLAKEKITPGTIYVISYNYATQSLQLLNTPTQQE